jgi:hypothetical protein
VSEPLITATSGPSWSALFGWIVTAVVAASATTATILWQIYAGQKKRADDAYAWVPPKVGKMAGEIVGLQTEQATMKIELEHQRRLNDGDRRGERLAALEAIVPALQDQMANGFKRIEDRLDSFLNKFKESAT